MWYLNRRQPPSTSAVKPGSLPLSTRVANLAGPISDFRILLRYYGLIPMLQWILYLEANPPKNRLVLLLARLENFVNVCYYPLEHIYWLAAHKIIPMKDSTRDWIGMWSCRFWAAYVVLYFVHLYEDWKDWVKRRKALDKKLSAKKRDDEDYIRGGKKKSVLVNEDEFDEEESQDTTASFTQLQAASQALEEEKKSLVANAVINAGYFPLTIHWSLEKSSFPDIGVGICGTIAAIGQLYTAWKAT